MSMGYLRPVGEYLSVAAGPSPGFRWPPGYHVAWLDSGTSALGVALRVAAVHSGHATPSVLLPGYTCPDVVGAAAWSGLRPVLVDTRPGEPWLDEHRVAAAVDPWVAAVVAPHFLGLRHPLESLAKLCREAGIVLVEDSAQLGPTSAAFRPAADLVILSFGRGKPVPAGGGALLYRAHYADAVEAACGTLPERASSRTGWRLKAVVQNAAMTRPGFALVRALPGLHVGETRYRPLQSVSRLGRTAAASIEGVLAGWGPGHAETARALREIVGRLGLDDLPTGLGWDGASPLLRYPVLLRDRAARDQICEILHRRRIGASAFYAHALPDLRGMPGVQLPGELHSARDFAARLLTLPCHSGVRIADLETMERSLIRCTGTPPATPSAGGQAGQECPQDRQEGP